MVHAFQEQGCTLQELLNHTSQHSSRPPSSDPSQHGRPRRPRSHRRRGGQPGHPGHTRTLIPVERRRLGTPCEEVDEVVVIKPEQCPHCHAPLAGDAPQPWRHQVIEMPPITPAVTESQWHQLVCATCGEVTHAPWPAGVPSHILLLLSPAADLRVCQRVATVRDNRPRRLKNQSSLRGLRLRPCACGSARRAKLAAGGRAGRADGARLGGGFRGRGRAIEWARAVGGKGPFDFPTLRRRDLRLLSLVLFSGAGIVSMSC